MINFIKKLIVKFLTRKALVVSNRATLEYFIVSHVTDDGYVSLQTTNGSYLPVSYKIFKTMFQVETQVVSSIYEKTDVVAVQYNRILLSTGESVLLANINETGIEDSLDSEYL